MLIFDVLMLLSLFIVADFAFAIFIFPFAFRFDFDFLLMLPQVASGMLRRQDFHVIIFFTPPFAFRFSPLRLPMYGVAWVNTEATGYCGRLHRVTHVNVCIRH